MEVINWSTEKFARAYQEGNANGMVKGPRLDDYNKLQLKQSGLEDSDDDDYDFSQM